MRGFLVKLTDHDKGTDFTTANYLIISTNAQALQAQVSDLTVKTGLTLLMVQEIDITNANVILLSQYYS